MQWLDHGLKAVSFFTALVASVVLGFAGIAHAQVPVDVLHSFSWSGAAYPVSLLQAADGTVYGASNDGGPERNGTIFRIAPDGTTATLHEFVRSEGLSPSSLIQGSDGYFYGTAGSGGTFDRGTVFRMTSDGSVSVLHSFTGYDGWRPGNLVEASDGSFFGTTSLGPDTIFRVTVDGTFNVLHTFVWAEGATPSSLVVAADGNLYGTTTNGGGALNAGTIFKMTPAGVLTVLYVFSGGYYPEHANGDGASPVQLIQSKDGNFYGMTIFGGAYGTGSAFKMTLDGTVTVLHSFSIIAGDGAFPSPGLYRGPTAIFTEQLKAAVRSIEAQCSE